LGHTPAGAIYPDRPHALRDEQLRVFNLSVVISMNPYCVVRPEPWNDVFVVKDTGDSAELFNVILGNDVVADDLQSLRS
jgi:hypothetical protein